MNRFAGTILIAILLLGSVALTQWHLTKAVSVEIAREVHGGHDTTHTEQGNYQLRLTCGFSAESDPFALDAASSGSAARLVIQQGEKKLLTVTKDFTRGTTFKVKDLKFTQKQPMLFVKATPAGDDATIPCALRIQLLTEDGIPCTDTTLWSAGDGQNLTGEVELSLQPMLMKVDRGLGTGNE